MSVIKCRTAKGTLNLWDLGGRKGLRKIWEHYYQQCHGILFFMDDRIQQGFTCLLNILLHPDMASIPLLIFTQTLECKQKIQKQLQSLNSNQAFRRNIAVEIISQKNIKNKQILSWFYSKILQLHEQLKKGQ